MEMLMQYVWNSRLLKMPLVGTHGQRIEVIDPGMQNTGAGPDFFNAKIIIDGVKWAGNVEMHVRASDWHKHHHDGDPAYDNVILHVVAESDTHISVADGREVTQMVLGDYEKYKRRWLAALQSREHQLPCASRLGLLDGFRRAEWIERLGIERLQTRSALIGKAVAEAGGDRDYVAYVMLARALGFGINSDAMERTARSVNPRCLMLQADSRLQVEAMLIGQSGLLGDTAADQYHSRLIDEYKFLSNKYNLTPLTPGMWRTGGLRPANAPMRRLALLAEFVRHNVVSASRLMSIETTDQARRLFDHVSGDYWHTHTRPGAIVERSACHLSRTSVDLLLINVVVPLIYNYGESTGDASSEERAVDLLCGLASESNAPVRLFAQCGIGSENAFTSQALLHLYRQYCTTKRCLSCRWAHYLIGRPILTDKPTPHF